MNRGIPRKDRSRTLQRHSSRSKAAVYDHSSGLRAEPDFGSLELD
jgi:hypothetical protein